MKKVLMLSIVALLAFTGPAMALLISDSPIHAQARHENPTWQWLGSSAYADDGVSWGTGSGSWGHGEINAGQYMNFGFDFSRASWGDHYYDQLQVWIDWNRDGVFTNGRVVHNGSIINEKLGHTLWGKSSTWAGDRYTYVYGMNIPSWAEGDYWLRARVSCDHTEWYDVTPYNTLWQGEVEDWKFTVTPRTPPTKPAPVPEPGTFALFGVGLVAMAAGLRKRAR